MITPSATRALTATLAITLSLGAATALAGPNARPRVLQAAPCAEIAKAIEWNNQIGVGNVFPVTGYVTLHNGLKSTLPIATTMGDQVWYATGPLTATDGRVPYLVGSLRVSTNVPDGEMKSKLALRLKVEIHMDGTIRYQRLLNGAPIGGAAPTEVQATCVDGDLLTAIDGGQVITVGVARGPSFVPPPD